MLIDELTLFIVHLRLRKAITHASASRQDSANVMVRCRLRDGTEGWGEGVPRSYVTGETPESAAEQFAATPWADMLKHEVTGWKDAVALCDRLQPKPYPDDVRECRGNALRCAVELSLLDAFGRLLGEPVAQVTRHFSPAAAIYSPRPAVHYSTTITAETPWRERRSALKMRAWGFRQCKIKVGMPGVDETKRLRRLRFWLGRAIDIRCDANEAWHGNQWMDQVSKLLPFQVTCIEQPVPHEELSSLAGTRGQLPLPVMLDESLTGQYDARQAIELGAGDLFNIRLSKCGGFLASLRLAALAAQSGIRYQLGCHPGESGVLSAAGRHWATTVCNIRYAEGSYDRYLLRELLTREDITFQYGGYAPALERPGLGVTVEPLRVRKCSSYESTCSLN